MPISHAQRFGFVHIPKTGGTSVMRAILQSGLALDYCGFGLWEMLAGRSDAGSLVTDLRRVFRIAELGTFPQQHLPASTLRSLVADDGWDSLFTFAFVRNPWDLMVSSYFFFKKHTEEVGASGADRDRVEMALRCDTFERFVHFYPVMRSDSTQMLVDASGRMLVDFVGRFETIESDIAAIGDRIGLRVDLPHLNATQRGAYRNYYTPSTRRAVAQHFQRDIDRFSYTF